MLLLGRTHPVHLVTIASRFGETRLTGDMIPLVTIPSSRFLYVLHFGIPSPGSFRFGLLQRQTVPSSLSDELISVPALTLAKPRFLDEKTTHISFQKRLSNPSSLVSSSVTPPNNTPMLFAVQRVIVHPLRKEGAYASDGLLRFSHKKVGLDCGGFVDNLVLDFGLDVGVGGGASDGSVILKKGVNWRKDVERLDKLKYPCIFEHHSYRALPFHIFFAVSSWVARLNVRQPTGLTN